MNLAIWLGALAWPLVSRVLVAAGVGTVTYAGVSTALNAALDAAKSSFGGLAGELSQILAMAGLFQAMSIIAGALIASLSWMVLKKFALQSTGA